MIVTRRISLGKLLAFTWPKLLVLVAFTATACLAALSCGRSDRTARSAASATDG
jgi:hypothetical protein